MTDTIIVNDGGYAMRRNAIDLPIRDVDFLYRKDMFKALRYIEQRLPFQVDNYRILEALYFEPSLRFKYLRNAVNVGPGPWGMSIEERLPFWFQLAPGWWKSFVWNRTAHPSCKVLVSQSWHSARLVEDDLRTSQFQFTEEILEKLSVIYPSQPVLVDRVNTPRPPYKFVFVGIQFYRKGGAELIRAFDRLLREGHPVELHLVTEIRNQPGSRTTKSEHRRTELLLNQHSGDGLILHGRLSNTAVLELFRLGHVGVLPTYRDSFGYSVLEAQSAGCPVISTNVGALPELNNDECGWVIPLPLDNEARVINTGRFAVGPASEALEKGIYEAVLSAIEHPSSIVEKGVRSIQRIRQFHSPALAAKELASTLRIN